MTYAQAGVDIAAGDTAIRRIRSLAAGTFTSGVISDIGSFGGLFAPNLSGLAEPVLISSADGVGTKLKLAFMSGVHSTVGEDLVNHCVNDILVHGAAPLFFLDYIATGKLNPDVIADLVSGIARGCKEVGCALIGGETAEMPDFYAPGEYDLAGFIVGIADRSNIITGAAIRPGDRLLALASNGLHTNGYSLARKVLFASKGLSLNDSLPGLHRPLGEMLMAVHRCYQPLVAPLLGRFAIHGMAHITGGGIIGNLSRIIPTGCSARVRHGSWPVPPIFHALIAAGDLDRDDAFAAFNMGVGFILVVPPEAAEPIIATLSRLNETVYSIGTVESGSVPVVMEGS